MSCYYPDGSPSKENDIPCNTSGYGPCCPDQWQCESNGLCYLENEGYYGRYTCTDQTWQSSSCPQICTHGIFHLMLARTEMKLTEDVDLTADGNEAVLECTSGSYCCDSNRPELSGGTACCEAGAPRFSLAALPLLPPYDDGDGGASASSAAPSPASSTQPPPPPSSAAAPTSSSSTPPPPASPSSAAAQTTSSSTTPPPPPSSSTAAQTSSTPPSSTPTSNTPTSTFQTSSTPLTSSTAPSTTQTSAPQTPSTSTTPTKDPSRSSLSAPGPSNPSIMVITETVTSDGSQSTLVSSVTSNVAGSASTSAPTKQSHLGAEVGGPIGGFVALIALAILLRCWRRRRSRRSGSTPRILQTNFIHVDPKSVVSSPFTRSSGTAPPDSLRSSTLVGTQDQHPQSAELHGSPTAGTLRNSRGSEFTRNAETGATTSPRQSGLPAMSEGGVGRTIAAELPATTSTYRPYRPPGWGDS